MTTGKSSVRQADDQNDETIRLEVLLLIKEAQSQHGLKHGDYHRYRSYCSRRLRRVRKSVGFMQATGRFKTTYVFKMLTNQMIVEAKSQKKDPLRYLSIPLICAERCWSYAMALKQEANTEPRKKFHLVQKLAKAVKYAHELERLTNDNPTNCDTKTKLETQAYCAYLSGIYHFEREEWIKASDLLKKSQAIYTKLSEAVSDDDAALHYRQRADELKPSLRYCSFNIGEQDIKAEDFIKTLKDAPGFEDEILAAKLDQLILQTREKSSSKLNEVNWLGKSIPVKDEKIRSFLISIKEYQKIENPKVTQLEKVLFECRDSIQILRDNNQEKTPLYCYLLYVRLDLTCKRNLLLIKNIENIAELIRPYEVLIGTLKEMESLPFQQYFSSDEGIEQLLNEIKAKGNAYQAFRCYYAAKVAKLTWQEAVALLERAREYCNSCLQNPYLEEDLKQQLEKLQSDAEVEKFTIYANNVIKSETNETVGKQGNKKLIERLDEYYEGEELDKSLQLTKFPPEFTPVPCKPLFYDLALNHLKFPSLEIETNSPKSGGITGMVKGWFWKK